MTAEIIDARRPSPAGGQLRLRVHGEFDGAEFLAPSILVGRTDESDLAALETHAAKQAS